MKCSEGQSVFDALKACLTNLRPDFHIEKIGFAKMTLETLVELAGDTDDDPEAAQLVALFETNMKVLFRKLRQMQRKAERELTEERVSQRVERAKQAFFQDHPSKAKREHAFVLLEEIEASLDNSLEGDEIRTQIYAMRRDFKIDDDVTQPVPDYPKFKERLEHLKYAGRLATQQTEPATPAAALRVEEAAPLETASQDDHSTGRDG